MTGQAIGITNTAIVANASHELPRYNPDYPSKTSFPAKYSVEMGSICRAAPQLRNPSGIKRQKIRYPR